MRRRHFEPFAEFTLSLSEGLGMTWVVVGLGLSTGGSVTPPAETVPDRTAFIGVSVLPMSTDTLLQDQTVLVGNGVVTQIGPRSGIWLPLGWARTRPCAPQL